MVAEPLPEPTRVVLYPRVSTDRQGRDGASLETQLDECRRFAHDRGWMIVGEYQDIMSGRRSDRPGYQAMLAAWRQYDAVLVWRFDQLGRDEPEFFTTVAELRRHGREVYSVKEPNGSPVITGILAVLAANESRQIIERVKPNMIRKAEAGHWIARAPYGYRFEGKALVVNPEQAINYREIIAMYLAGQSLTRIARTLNERGVPPSNGKQWFGRALRWMLSSPSYVGDVVWAGKVYPGRHAPLIDRATWEEVQANLAARAHEPRDTTPNHLLTGFVVCRHCGYRMHRHQVRGRWAWYRCSARTSGIVCDNRRHARLEDVEGYVMTVLAPLFQRPSAALVAQALDLIREQQDRHAAGRERARLERDIAQARRRLTVAREKLLDGLLTDAEYLETRQRYQADIDAGSAALAALGSVKAPDERHLMSVAQQIKTLADAWHIASLGRRRELLTLLGLRLTWDGLSLSHTIRRDVALLLGDVQNGRLVGPPS